MKIINKRLILILSVIIIFSAITALLMFSMFTNAEEYALKSVNAHLYDDGVLLNAGDIVDINGNKIAYTENGERCYSSNTSTRAALLHIIGDNQGFIDGGIQDTFREELCSYSLLYGVNTETKNTLQLTLDSELCAYAYEQLYPYKGCIAVCNYKTGELICIASSPSYDMFNKPTDIENNSDYEGVYINRLYGGLYTPGSVFKLVTALAAVENIEDIHTQSFYCDGSYDSGEGIVICNDVHGTVTFSQALNYSCNCAFAQIAVQLGADKINAAFTLAGLDSSKDNCDRILYTAGKFRTTNEDSLGQLGWAGIGQADTLVNPYSFLSFICSIANGGTSYEPYFVSSAVNSNNRVVYSAEPELSKCVLSETTAATLKEMMRSTVTNYYGDYRFGELTMCGKTGTAERDNDKPHAWFAGFSYDEDFPYAVVAVLENSGSGLQYAGTAASAVLQKVYNSIN